MTAARDLCRCEPGTPFERKGKFGALCLACGRRIWTVLADSTAAPTIAYRRPA